MIIRAKPKLGKAILAYLLVLAIILSFVSTIGLPTQAAVDAWDGTVASAYAGGSGTQADPYQIATAGQLALLATKTTPNYNTGAYYQLTADIVLNDTTRENWKDTARSWYTWSGNWNAFCGHLDGDGHLIKGLYIRKTSENPTTTAAAYVYAGLFAALGDGAVVDGVGFVDADIELTGAADVEGTKADGSAMTWKASVYAGLVAGTIRAGGTTPSITRCFADTTTSLSAVAVSGGTGDRLLGGLIGGTPASFAIENCYFTGKLSGGTSMGGLFGSAWGGTFTLTNCYTTSMTRGGGSITNTNVYSTTAAAGVTQVTGEQLYAADMAGKLGSAFETVSNDMPKLAVFTGYDGNPVKAIAPGTPWSGEVAERYAGGTGSQADPYQIATAEQLALLVSTSVSSPAQTAGKYYVLTADILLNDVEQADWTAAAQEWYTATMAQSSSFRGSFDGKGHLVEGLYINKAIALGSGTDSIVYGGLFPVLGNGASVANVGIVNASITMDNTARKDGMYAGAIAGFVSADGVSLAQCFADSTADIKGQMAGGLLGGSASSFTMTNCYFAGQVAGSNKTGALVGTTWADKTRTVENCYAATRNADPLFGQETSVTYKNVYSTTAAAGVTQVTGEQLYASDMAAKLGSAFETVPDDMPKLAAFTGYDGNPVKAIVPGASWDGSVASAYAGGTGSQADPYQIATAGQLALLATKTNGGYNVGKYYQLTADIVLNDTTQENWKDTARPWYTWNNQWNAFCGHLDGDGHLIKGLYIHKEVPSSDSLAYAGLFATLNQGATVKGVGFVDADIAVTGAANIYAGLIAGSIRATANEAAPSITQCFGDATTSVSASTTGEKMSALAGGLLGAAPLPAAIENCYFTGKLTGTSANGFIGNRWDNTKGNTTITSSYTTSAVQATNDKTALVYNNVYSTVTATVNVDKITLEALCADTMAAKLGTAAVWSTVEGNSPKLAIFTSYDGRPGEGVKEPEEDNGDKTPGVVWNGTVATQYAAGNGTAKKPYLITTAEQLARMLSTCIANPAGTAGKYYALTDDILLNDVTKADWTKNARKWYTTTMASSGAFKGSFDGRGHVIKGLYINETATATDYSGVVFAGLFPSLGEGASIANTGIVNASVKAESTRNDKSNNVYAGAFAGFIEAGNVSFAQCFADSTVSVQGDFTGGLLGGTQMAFSMTNCYFTGRVAGSNVTGALAGTTWNEANKKPVTNCYAATRNSDGLFGQGSGIIYQNVYCRNPIPPKGVTAVTPEQIWGAAAKNTMKALDFDTVWSTVEGNSPKLKVFAGYDGNPNRPLTDMEPEEDSDPGTPGRVWDGTVAKAFAGGNGTQQKPYQIATAEQLALLVKTCISSSAATADKYYVLTHDILLNDVTKANWTGNARQWFTGNGEGSSFRGVLNGNGHLVKGLYIHKDVENELIFGALLPCMAYGAKVSGVGIVNADIQITSKRASGAYAACISGYVKNDEGYVAAIDQCFGDATVRLSSNGLAGGLVGGAPKPVAMTNCYFTGKLALAPTRGGLIGNRWNETATPSTAKSCYSATEDGDTLVPGGDYMKYTDVYYASKTLRPGPTRLPVYKMCGEAAKTNMPGLDFASIWETVDEGTPKLRIFKSYTAPKATIPDVTITFVTDCDQEVDPIVGRAGDEIVWPVLRRGADLFDGWYVYDTFDVRYPLDVFPGEDVTLYAKWIKVSIDQGFENYPFILQGSEGLGLDYEYYRPGTLGYSSTYVRSGSKCLHRKGVDPTAGYQNVSLYDEEMEPLVPGKEYTLSFWVYLESYNDLNDKLMLAYLDGMDTIFTDFDFEDITTLGTLKKGEWHQVTTTFVAQTEYLALRTPGLTSLYIDDVMLVPTGKTDSNFDNMEDNPSLPSEKEPGNNGSGNGPEDGNHGADTGEGPMLEGAIALLVCSAAVFAVSFKKRTFKGRRPHTHK